MSVTPLRSGVKESTHARGLAHPQRRELAYRASDGLEVTLLWHTATDELVVCVSDQRYGGQFEIRPERHGALDAYYHPYAYAAAFNEVHHQGDSLAG